MEPGTEHSQRQIKLRRQDKNEKCLLKFHPRVKQPESDLHCDHCCAQRGKQLQC